MRQHVLDANALLRYLTKETGYDSVHAVLTHAREAGMPVLISAVNWGEVYYTLAKRIGLDDTERAFARLAEELGILVITVDNTRARGAARLKCRFNLPYADAFAAELTGTQNVLVTADVKDFQRVPKIRLLKLPPKKAN